MRLRKRIRNPVLIWGDTEEALPRWLRVVKNLSARTRDVGDTGSRPGLRRSLEEKMTAHSSILAWKIQWTEEPGGLQYMRSQRVRHTELTWLRGDPMKTTGFQSSSNQNTVRKMEIDSYTF